MRHFLLLLTTLFSFFAATAQDILTKKNGDELQVKVLEIGLSEIKYKSFDNLEGPTYSVPKAEIFSIKYKNGAKDVFTDNSQSSAIAGRTPQEMYLKGRSDAADLYKGYKSASTGTLIVGLLSPLIGLVPAIACSSTTPKDSNLGFTNPEEFKNLDYQNGYKQNAKKIKSRKVWSNLGIAFGVNLLVVLALSQQ